MPEDQNLELLAVIHSLQVASQVAQKMLGNAIEVSTDAGFFPMTLETAIMTQSLLAFQSKVIRNLVEQNQEILDRLNAFLTRLDQQ